VKNQKKPGPKPGDTKVKAIQRPTVPNREAATHKPIINPTQEPPKATAGDERLKLAVQNLRLDEVRSLVAAGANVNAIEIIEGLNHRTFRTENYKRPLIHSVLSKDYPKTDELRLSVEIAQVLLDAGADIDARDERNSNKTLLMRATSGRHAVLVKYLIERGANTKLKDSDGNTVFGAVIKRNRWDDNEVKAILANSTDDGKVWLESSDGKGWTRATAIDEKAPIPTIRGDTSSVLQAALKNDDNEQFRKVVQWVEQGGDLEWRGPNGWTALHIAAQCANEKMLSLLLGRGANIEALDDEGGTPLMLACNFGYMPLKPSSAVVSLLLDEGANPNAQDKTGRTALKLIRQSGLDEAKMIAQILVDRGTIQTPGKDWFFTFCCGCSRERVELADGGIS
jgi:ankyrin repeat protein